MHWRRKWQPTPMFLPGESQGRRSLVGCCLRGRRVGHDWNDLAAAAAELTKLFFFFFNDDPHRIDSFFCQIRILWNINCCLLMNYFNKHVWASSLVGLRDPAVISPPTALPLYCVRRRRTGNQKTRQTLTEQVSLSRSGKGTLEFWKRRRQPWEQLRERSRKRKSLRYAEGWTRRSLWG